MTINSLDNLPQYYTFTQTDGEREANLIRSVNQDTRVYFDYFPYDISDPANEPVFKEGDTVEVSFNVGGSTRRIRIYGRGKNAFNNDLTGYAVWDYLSGVSNGTVIGQDANTGVYRQAAGQVTVRIKFTQPSWGFYFNISGVDGTGAAVGWSGHWIFNYINSSAEITDDPYSVPGTSYPAGGDGTFDFTSTDIPIPGLPSISATSTGFCALYNPSTAGMQALASYLWSGAFDIDNYRKIMANPMDAILGCHIIPVISGHPTTAMSELYVGNISTGISMARFTEQYYALDCGTVNVLEKWGAYLDYSPYTKLQLYLPYIGYVSLKTDDVMGGSIGVTYHVDIVSGSVCAFVYCVSKDGFGHVLYSYTGACACDVPITEGQYTNAVLGILQIAGAVGQTALSGAIGSASGVMGGVQNAANAALSMTKPEISRSGSFGGSAGLMGIQYPYLILETPRMCIPGQQNKFIGYPSFMTVQLNALSGYNEIEINHLNNMTCTGAEADEIINLLQSGVIF